MAFVVVGVNLDTCILIFCGVYEVVVTVDTDNAIYMDKDSSSFCFNLV